MEKYKNHDGSAQNVLVINPWLKKNLTVNNSCFVHVITNFLSKCDCVAAADEILLAYYVVSG